MDKYRPALPSDFPAICSLLAANDLIWQDLTLAQLPDFLVIADASGEAISPSLVAVAGLERFAGCDAALLRSVAVDSKRRGLGLGAALVTALEARARSLAVEQFWLLTTTAPQFFTRLGYLPAPRETAPKAVRQSSEFQGLCPATATCLAKLL